MFRSWLSVVLLCVCSNTALAAVPILQFLYINANEGAASGGHVALRIDDEVFHFQHVEPGLLRLFRADFNDFCFQYAIRENRTLYRHTLDVDFDTLQALKQAFERRLLVQDSHFQYLKSLDREQLLGQQLLQWLQASGDTDMPVTMPIKALGYFVAPTDVNASKQSASLLALKQALAEGYGSDFLQQTRLQLHAQLRQLQAQVPPQAPKLDEQKSHWPRMLLGQRYEEILTNWAALEVLEAAAPLSPIHLKTEARQALDPAALAALARYRQNLHKQLASLWRSGRQDWGQALLVGMARLQALDESMQRKHLSVLARPLFSGHSGAFSASAAARWLDQSERALQRALMRLDNRIALDEQEYGELELAVNTVVSVRQQIDHQQGLRLQPLGSRLPLLSGEHGLLPLEVSVQQMNDYLGLLEGLREQWLQQMTERYAYHLLQRNCVTELFRQLQLAMEPLARPGETAVDASQRLLGGYIDAGGLQLIPFAAFDSVGAQYRVQATDQVDSYRQHYLQQAAGQDGAWSVELRESNVLSSAFYRAPDSDSAFLFFTQDSIWPRPLQGSLNMLAAASQATLGLFYAPWDGGIALKRGLLGMVISLPELLFFNIRKGSFPDVLPSEVNYLGEAEGH